ncbi:MAG: AMP-binding protein [Gaiellaceae bacterium]|jgi:acyl-coenzyme A synthetase/AMP-(fatty) acid ligase
MIPELPVAMLACARLGAPHCVIFGGFSAESLADRANDFGAEILITQDEGYRRGKPLGLKKIADEAIANTPCVKKMLVVTHSGGGAPGESAPTLLPAFERARDDHRRERRRANPRATARAENLIENALRRGEAAELVLVWVSRTASDVLVRVTNRGRPGRPRYLLTEAGAGYRLVDPETRA